MHTHTHSHKTHTRTHTLTCTYATFINVLSKETGKQENYKNNIFFTQNFLDKKQKTTTTKPSQK